MPAGAFNSAARTFGPSGGGSSSASNRTCYCWLRPVPAIRITLTMGSTRPMTGQRTWEIGPGHSSGESEPAEMIRLLKSALTNEPEGYHPDALIFRFLNNNDTGTRFITTHGEDLTRVATALLLTLPGLPCIYTADEAGQWFRPYFDAAPVSFKERYPGLRDYHKKLIALRKDIHSLHSRLWQIIEVEPASQVLGYIRFLQ